MADDNVENQSAPVTTDPKMLQLNQNMYKTNFGTLIKGS